LAITDLQKKLERSSAERRVADEKQSSRPTWTKSCHSLRSGKRISLALGELEEKIAESERKSSEPGKKDSTLQSTRRDLGEARQLAKDANTECDREKAAF